MGAGANSGKTRGRRPASGGEVRHAVRARALVRELRRRGPVHIRDLVDDLGVRENTLRETIRFLRAGEVLDLRDHLLRFNPDIGILAGVEIIGRRATAAVTRFDLADADIESIEIPIEDPDQCMRQIAELVARLLTTGTFRDHVSERLVGVGVALPGPILRELNSHESQKQASKWNREPETGTILPGWDAYPVGAQLATLLMKEYGIVPPRHAHRRFVWVENDASAGALGVFNEWALHPHTPRPDDLIYVRMTWGIGAGIISKAHLLTGAHGFAGELGHVIVEPSGRLCPVCGARGCLETVASDRALTEQLRTVLTAQPSGPEDEEWVKASFSKGLQPLLQAHHPAVDRVLRDAGNFVGAALGNLFTMLDPGCVVLGGDQAEHRSYVDGRRPFIDAVDASLRSIATRQVVSGDRLQIKTWRDIWAGSPSPELVGALALVIDHLGDGYLLDPIDAWMNKPNRIGPVNFGE